MELLIYFALPIATVIFSIVLQKILRNPILVALTIFAIYLVVIFTLFAFGVITNLGTALVALIIYTLISFLTAYIVKVIKKICSITEHNNCCCRCCENNLVEENTSNANILNNDIVNATNLINNNQLLNANNNEANNNSNGDLLRITCRCNDGNSQDLLSVNSNCLNSNNNNCGCRNNNQISTVENNLTDQTNIGTLNSIRRCYRR